MVKQLDFIPEIETVANENGMLNSESINLLERATEILVHANMDENLVDKMHWLVTLVCWSVGDFKKGMETAKKLINSSPSEIETIIKKMQVLEKPQDYFDKKNLQFDGSSKLLSNAEILENIRSLIKSEDNDSNLAKALDLLDNTDFSCSDNSQKETTPKYSMILQKVEDHFTKETVKLLLGLTLGEMAKKLHKEEQAVSSEGLFRAGLNHLNSVEQPFKEITKPSINIIGTQYADLLQEWEKRENEAQQIRKQYMDENECIKNHTFILLNLSP